MHRAALGYLDRLCNARQTRYRIVLIIGSPTGRSLVPLLVHREWQKTRMPYLSSLFTSCEAVSWSPSKTCLLQVLTGVQHAMALVHAYPSLLHIDNLLDCLAAQHKEPSRQQLLAVAHTVDTAVHFESLYAYVSNLREDQYPVYVPFSKVPNQTQPPNLFLLQQLQPPCTGGEDP